MLYFVLIAVAVGFLVLEQQLHRRRLRSIPLRIHVNGTRGKTSVTRLTAELLRRAGIRTFAKTTGDHPELILPDGRSTRIRRRGAARIQEQLALIAEAAGDNAEAVVVECMALEPRLQEVSERAMVRSTIGVITNVRPDHFEVMGRSLEQVAQALSCTIPACAALVTESGPYEPLLRERCEAAGTRICMPSTDGAPPGDAAPRSALDENLSVVRAIGLQAGLPAETVDGILQEMAARERRQRPPQVGSGPRRIVLLDAFSANDVVSTARVQDGFLSLGETACPRPVVALLNTRADRPLRTLSFVEFIAAQTCYAAIVLAGDGCFLARRRLRPQAVTAPLLTLTEREPSTMLSAIARLTGASSFTLVGMGNHRGAGEALRRYFAKDNACC
jgi:poly-gamma-glutamate synthase PgsB/CapB